METTTEMTAAQAAYELQRIIDDGRLLIEPRAIPIVARCFMVDYKAFMRSIYYITRNRNARVTLYPDGGIEELSFGVLWHTRPRAYGWEDAKTKEAIYREVPKEAQAFMLGGLIYRGPNRGGRYDIPNQSHHEWTSHT